MMSNKDQYSSKDSSHSNEGEYFTPGIKGIAGRNSAFKEDDDISLNDIVLEVISWMKYLGSKWLLIVTGCLVGGVLGFYYANSQKIIYKAELSFALEDENAGGGLGGALGLASQFGFDVGGSGGGGPLLAITCFN